MTSVLRASFRFPNTVEDIHKFQKQGKMPNYDSPKQKFNLKHEVMLALTKLVVIVVVGVACAVAILYCTHIYYDREQALYDALVCTQDVLGKQQLTTWITNGTLLGAVRLGRFVMWDGELDVAVLHAGGGTASDSVATAVEVLETQCFPYSSSMQGTALGQPRRWRLCTSRVCAEIHEFVSIKDGKYFSSIDGVAPHNQTLPTVDCQVQGIDVQCPANTTFFLDAAFGGEWKSGSLTAMF